MEFEGPSHPNMNSNPFNTQELYMHIDIYFSLCLKVLSEKENVITGVSKKVQHRSCLLASTVRPTTLNILESR